MFAYVGLSQNLKDQRTDGWWLPAAMHALGARECTFVEVMRPELDDGEIKSLLPERESLLFFFIHLQPSPLTSNL